MKKHTILFAAFAVLISFSACKKDRIEPKSEYEPINEYLDSKKQEEQSFEITGPSNDTITGNQGTKLLAGKDCLRFANGDSVSYPFTVKLVELYTPKDMIYWQMPTIAAGSLLATDGEIRVRAVKNGEDLVLRPYCYYRVMMPNSSPASDMTKFYGVNNGTFVDWTDDVAGLGVTTAVSSLFSADAYGYVGDIPLLGWLNCGKIAGSGGSAITFSSDTDVLTNVGIFVYFPDTKTVMQVRNMTSDLIPNGSGVKIILIGMKAPGDMYYYYTETTINGATDFDVELTSISDADLTALLDEL
ncbi:MAG: hypothetical protein H6587_02600 [Flavobacteriales bacterium]|nr:hypothetical protein [Flavobacteriales bacterium]MCB9363436.1 hypothetical protein [Flavobacteriales bacterium]